MIILRNVTKTYQAGGVERPIVRGLSMSIPRGRNLALMGRNGAGKSTFLRMIAGVVKPDEGEIIRQCRVSWPLGFSGSFHKALTGYQNILFTARIYDVNVDDLTAFVEDFSELGVYLEEPVSTYSSGMKARLAFGLSMGVRFDVYLVDETIAVGDRNFKTKCRRFFTERAGKSDVIMVSHNENVLRSYCDCGLVLDKGRVRYFDDLEEAIDHHAGNLRASRTRTQADLTGSAA